MHTRDAKLLLITYCEAAKHAARTRRTEASYALVALVPPLTFNEECIRAVNDAEKGAKQRLDSNCKG